MTEEILSADEKSVISAISASELADFYGPGSVLNRLHCLAEFNLNAEFMRVNENYQQLMGYAAVDLLGKNLSMLLDLKYQHSQEYQLLWQRLRQGETVSGQFKRLASGAKTVWITATYVPIVELTGQVLKVVEYATDVTEHVMLKQDLAETVQQVKAVLLAVQNGDLSQQISVAGKTADLAGLCADVNTLIASTTSIVELIRLNGSYITEAAVKLEAACLLLVKSHSR